MDHNINSIIMLGANRLTGKREKGKDIAWRGRKGDAGRGTGLQSIECVQGVIETIHSSTIIAMVDVHILVRNVHGTMVASMVLAKQG